MSAPKRSIRKTESIRVVPAAGGGVNSRDSSRRIPTAAGGGTNTTLEVLLEMSQQMGQDGGRRPHCEGEPTLSLSRAQSLRVGGGGGGGGGGGEKAGGGAAPLHSHSAGLSGARERDDPAAEEKSPGDVLSPSPASSSHALLQVRTIRVLRKN